MSITSEINRCELTTNGAAGDNLTNISPPSAAADIPAVLNDLDDVIISSPIDGDVLRYNGSEWTNDVAGAVTFTSITIAGNTLDTNEWSNLDGLDQQLATSDDVVFNDIAGAAITGDSLVAGTLTLADGSITDSGGTISFGNEILETTGAITGGVITGTSGIFGIITCGGQGIKLLDDIGETYHLIFNAGGTELTANRIFTIDVGNAARTIKFSGNPTLGDWFDQNVKIAATPEWNAISVINTILAGDSITGNSFITGEYIGPAADPDLLAFANGVLTVNGTLDVETQIRHKSDTDTGMLFAADNIYFKAGNLEMIRFRESDKESDEVIVNENGVDIDFRVEATGQANALFVQGSDGKVGIRDAAPGEVLDVNGNINATGVLKIDDVQVVSNQGAAVADATDADDVILRLNDLLARARAHGLIAT